MYESCLINLGDLEIIFLNNLSVIKDINKIFIINYLIKLNLKHMYSFSKRKLIYHANVDRYFCNGNT